MKFETLKLIEQLLQRELKNKEHLLNCARKSEKESREQGMDKEEKLFHEARKEAYNDYSKIKDVLDDFLEQD